MNFQVSNQSDIIENQIKASFYQNLHLASKKTGWMRLSGLPVGIISGVLTIARRVALLAEAVIKGVANILGCSFSSNCFLSTGLGQLIIDIPTHLFLLPFSLLSAGIGLFSKTAFMAIDPEDYTLQRWLAHDPVENQKQKIAIQQRNWQAQVNAFNQACQNQNDPNSLKYIADCFKNGHGVQQDPIQAVNYYTQAAEKGDVESMFLVGKYFKEGTVVPQDDHMAYGFFKMAADRNHIDGMVFLGISYEFGQGTDQNYTEAWNWYAKAANLGNPQAMGRYGAMMVYGHGGMEKNLKEAVSIFRRAANLGDTLSMSYLSGILFKHPELQISPVESMEWITKASESPGYNGKTHSSILLEMNLAT